MQSEWAILGDTHWGARSDSRVLHKIYERFYSEVFFPELERRGVTKLFQLGDCFDRRKFVSFETLDAAKRVFFDVALSKGIEVFMIAGNHDVTYRNTNRLNSLEQLVGHYPNVHIFTEAKTIEVEGVRVLMCPWINSENYASTYEEITRSDAEILVGHLELAGFEYHRGMLSTHGHIDTDLLFKFDHVWTGHYHHRSRNGNIVYVGTPYEMTWNDYNDEKGFHFWKGEELEFFPNPHTNFIRLVYSDKEKKLVERMIKEFDYSSLTDRFVKVVLNSKNHPILFEQFIDKILEAAPVDCNIVDETSYIVESENEVPEEERMVSKGTLEIVDAFIENLETDLDKNRVKSMIQALYIEAKKSSEDE